LEIGGIENVEATYSDFEDNFAGEGNISEDPLFVDPDNGDFHLTVDSPCIDAGDPEAPDDPDGSRADMGAFPYLRRGTMQGIVLDHATGDPIPDARIRTDYGQEAIADDRGFFILPDLIANLEYDLTASARGFIDSTLIDLQVGVDDTLDVTIRLLHPELALSEEFIDVSLSMGETEDVQFSMENRGNYPLNWIARRGLQGDVLDPWRRRIQYNIGEIAADDRIEGVVFTGGNFYISGSGGERGPQIYILNRDGDLIGSFDQFVDDDRGFRDLAWDGELIWAVAQNQVYSFSTEGELLSHFEAPGESMQAITWDPDRELLWLCGITTEIWGFDRAGNERATLERYGFHIYGLAYWQYDPDEHPLLYILHNPENNRQLIHKLNPETGDTMFVAELFPENDGRPGGAFITNEYDIYNWVLMNVSNASVDEGRDRIDVWQIEGRREWFRLDSYEGVLNPDMEQEFTLTFDPSGWVSGIDLAGFIAFYHNAADGASYLPVRLNIIPSSVDPDEVGLPKELAITGIYPNPFNAVTRINYSLQMPEYIELAVFDLTGRKVDVIDQGYKPGGYYTASYDASLLPSGVYILSLTTAERSSVRKMLLIK